MGIDMYSRKIEISCLVSNQQEAPLSGRHLSSGLHVVQGMVWYGMV